MALSPHRSRSPSGRGPALLTEGGQAQHGDQQGVIPAAAVIAGIAPIGQDVPVGRVIQVIHEGT